MTVTSATSATTTAGTASSSALASLSTNMNTFLTMLTTQLQNQDPTAPVDSNQFTQQLVQLTSVEQQIATNTNLQQLVALQQVAQVTSASGLVGKAVEVESDQLSLQDGVGQVRLPAAGTATQAQVQVLGASGEVLRTATVALGSASTTWSWDGRDSSGTRHADGAYGIKVTGLTGTGSTTALSHTVVANATAAERVNGTAQLVLGGLTVGFDKVRGLAGGG
ncbi:flagellar biosynthesis protein FlgD [Roseomonas sp. NAR14]|uniref:Basal-body rod modification protein FlgD n=1 Tax=Roseomonas acroporae TaxID=2937791 RepID=A0A9X2BUG5_9PROT|nr:flagellar hook capping FlgD N-terminal domain-containing protein [Roseomonas acroporae]MCK8783044.1 flagellar biosynthesis protein FlgD [Roseomonas acroporae]